MKKMVVKVVTTPGGEILEEATFQSQIMRGLVRRPGPGVAAQLKVSLLGREIEDSPQWLASRNQDITLGEPTYGPDGTFTDPTFGDLEASKLQDRTQWEASRRSQVMLK